MKELRPRGSNLRVFFAFDPRRHCVLLIGGDKTDRWEEFYDQMTPIADELYETYLEELRAEGVIQ